MGGFHRLRQQEGYKPFGQHSSSSITNYYCGVCVDDCGDTCVCNSVTPILVFSAASDQLCDDSGEVLSALTS